MKKLGEPGGGKGIPWEPKAILKRNCDQKSKTTKKRERERYQVTGAWLGRE